MNANAPAVVQDEEISHQLPVGYEGGGMQSLAVALSRAEVDTQIATARAMPRSIQRAVQNILTLATLDEETAEECIYALPRGGKPIKGPSVRLAEIIAGQWGNCRVGARVVHVDRFEKYIEAEGVFHDLETNTATTARVRRRISDKNGRVFNDDMIVVTGNAACAIAKRNAILGAVPKAVWRKAYTAVESVLAGDVKTLVERRDRAMKAFAAFGVTPEQIFTALDVQGVDDITLDHMATLTGMHSSLKTGEATVEEMFPRIAAAGSATDRPKDLKSKLDQVAEGDTQQNKADEAEEPGPTEAARKDAGALAKSAPQPQEGAPASTAKKSRNSQAQTAPAEASATGPKAGSKEPKDAAPVEQQQDAGPEPSAGSASTSYDELIEKYEAACAAAATVEDLDKATDIVTDALDEMSLDERTRVQNAFEAHEARIKSAAAPAEEETEEVRQLRETARAKAKLGSKRLKLWRGALSAEHEKLLAPIADELNELAAYADSKGGE
ncbi:hypothetical protein [Chelatococcus sp. XZ-Ab1]|uniref:hypothetical protein n=1 Tax=Chelatococcus sp. XZ-Ab1 TaxID=3034027 RepID=UPI0023E38249|nr:hypothetical protein [Chelatococcus sp. XZ-Ab1]